MLNRTETTFSRFGTLPFVVLFLAATTSISGFKLPMTSSILLRSLAARSRGGYSSYSSLVLLRAATNDAPSTIASLGTPVTTFSTPLAESEPVPSSAPALDDIAALCKLRNLPFEKIKNARDLSSASSIIKPNRLFRMGRLSDATESDISLLLNKLDMHTLIDLRSPTELKEDRVGVLRSDVFDPFVGMVWKESGRKDGCVRELPSGDFPVKKPFWNRRHKAGSVEKAMAYDVMTASTVDNDSTTLPDDELLCDLDCDDPDFSVPASQLVYKDRRERHFVSLMNELKYVRGTLGRVRKRDTLKAVMKAPGALVSSRVRTSVKEPFLQKINQGGLLMLNELLLRYGAPGIKYVLDLCSDRQRHPVGFYCTAGKDRTGMITAIILSLCGADREDIVRDYSLSANVYAEMNDHQAMVGALSQRSLDPKTFLGAPASVMRETLEAIDKEYGSVEGYCTWMGFGPEQQEKLRRACMDD